MGSGGRIEPNNHQLARIGEKKMFHEVDVHHVQKVGIKRFWAQEAEMSLTAKSSLVSARRKFFIDSTYIISKSRNQTFLGSGGQNESNSKKFAGIGEMKFFINSRYILSRK